MVIGYFIWESVIYIQRKKLIKRASTINKLECKIKRYEPYVPICEKHKEEILEYHMNWATWEQIWNVLRIHGSTVNKWIHKWLQPVPYKSV